MTIYVAADAVRALSADLARQDAAIEAKHADITAMRDRDAMLGDRHAALAARPPAAARDFENEMAARLAADATASLDAAELAQAADRRDAAKRARDDWETNVDLLDQARGTVARQIEAAKVELAALQKARERVWSQFVKAAHGDLIDQFRGRFAALYNELLLPMMALATATDAAGRDIVPRIDAKLSSETIVTIDSYPAGQHQRETLFDWGEETGHAARAAASATIADYRRRLEA